HDDVLVEHIARRSDELDVRALHVRGDEGKRGAPGDVGGATDERLHDGVAFHELDVEPCVFPGAQILCGGADGRHAVDLSEHRGDGGEVFGGLTVVVVGRGLFAAAG